MENFPTTYWYWCNYIYFYSHMAIKAIHAGDRSVHKINSVFFFTPSFYFCIIFGSFRFCFFYHFHCSCSEPPRGWTNLFVTLCACTTFSCSRNKIVASRTRHKKKISDLRQCVTNERTRYWLARWWLAGMSSVVSNFYIVLYVTSCSVGISS